MPTTLSAETQKWFDQNHTKRSTKPTSAVAAASKRALASLSRSCCGNGGGGGWLAGFGGGAGGAMLAASDIFADAFDMLAGPPAIAALLASASCLARCASFCWACCSARKSATWRAASALDGSTAAI